MPNRQEQVRVQKAHEVVAERLRKQIVSGQLAIGETLPPEEELTVTFGIARTTLREALRVLESQGLITIRRGRGGGPTVTRPDIEPVAQGLAIALQLQGTTIGDLDDARQLVEPQLAARLARSHTADDVTALAAAIDEASAAAEADDGVWFGAAAAAVHETLIERSGNRTLTMISLLLHELVNTYYLQGAETTGQQMRRRAVRSYRRLLRLIDAGDAEGAEEHWRRQMAFTLGRRNRDDPLDMYGHLVP